MVAAAKFPGWRASKPSSGPPPERISARFTIPKLRWIIAGLLLDSTLINYTDRMTLSVLIGDVSKDLKQSANDYGQIVSLFFLADAGQVLIEVYMLP